MEDEEGRGSGRCDYKRGRVLLFLDLSDFDMTAEIVNSATKKHRKLEICVLPVCVWLYGV